MQACCDGLLPPLHPLSSVPILTLTLILNPTAQGSPLVAWDFRVKIRLLCCSKAVLLQLETFNKQRWVGSFIWTIQDERMHATMQVTTFIIPWARRGVDWHRSGSGCWVTAFYHSQISSLQFKFQMLPSIRIQGFIGKLLPLPLPSAWCSGGALGEIPRWHPWGVNWCHLVLGLSAK